MFHATLSSGYKLIPYFGSLASMTKLESRIQVRGYRVKIARCTYNVLHEPAGKCPSTNT